MPSGTLIRATMRGLLLARCCGQIGVVGAQYRDLVRRSRTPRAGKTFDMCRGGLVRALAGKGPRSGRMYAERGSGGWARLSASCFVERSTKLFEKGPRYV